MEKLTKISLKKKKSVLDFNIFIKMLNNKDFYVIENNIKNFDKKIVSTIKRRKIIKSGILLSKHIIFRDHELIKYFLSFLYFVNLKDFNNYIVSVNKKNNLLPVIIKVKFLFFKKKLVFSKYLFIYEKLYCSLNVRLKPISFFKN
jgi:hypothetical protein